MTGSTDAMMWILYNVLFGIAALLVLPFLGFRMIRRGGFTQRFMERLAVYRPDVQRALETGGRAWVHAVSVGEVYVALRFMEEFRALRPGTSFVLSTTTTTGRAIAERNKCADDAVLYFPLDLPFLMRRALRTIRPRMLLLMECELWPNLIRLCASAGIPVVLLNGRISASSARGYRWARVFFAPVLATLRCCFVQTPSEKAWLVEMGVSAETIRVVGSAKYDAIKVEPGGETRAREVLRAAGIPDDASLWVAGSTWPGEERAVLEVYKRLRPEFRDLKLVLAPRHVERRRQIEEEIRTAGLRWVRRSKVADPVAGVAGTAPPDVLLLDTTGELRDFYAAATVIFVGHSLVPGGGHSIIEPAIFAKPIVVGRHLDNFPVVASDFLTADAVVQVKDKNGLHDAVAGLLRDETLRAGYGERAAGVVKTHGGSVRESVAALLDRLES